MRRDDQKVSRKELAPNFASTLSFNFERIVSERGKPFSVASHLEESVPSFIYESAYHSDEIREIRQGKGDSVVSVEKAVSKKTKKLECLCVNGECAPGSEFCRQPCPRGWSGNLCSIPDDRKVRERKQKEE